MSASKLPLLSQDEPKFKRARSTNLLQNYDPAAYPPDLRFSLQHGLSRRVGRYIPPLCCLEPISKTELPLCCDLPQLFHCGTSTPLYFQFVKQCLLLLIFNILIITLPASIVNFTLGNECAITDGVTNFLNSICRGSVINIMNVSDINEMQIEAVIFFVGVLSNIVFIGFLQLKMDLLVLKYRQGKLNAADYSFMIKGLPRDITLGEIQKYVQDKMLYSGAPDLVINRIYIIYNFKNYLNMVQKRQEIAQKNIELWHKTDKIESKNLLENNYKKKEAFKNKKQQLQKQIQNNMAQMLKIQQEISTFQQTTSQIQQRIAEGAALEDQSTQSISNFSGKCIITLNNRRSQQRVLSKIEQTCCQRLSYSVSDFLGGQKSKISIAPAPEPEDIIFANMGSKRVIIWRNRILYSLLIFLLLGIDFLIVALAKKLIKQGKAIQNGNIIFSFINSIIVSLFCSLFRRIIRSSQQDSYYNTYSKLCYEMVAKMIVVFMVNMLFTTFVANVASFYLIKEDVPTFQAFPLNFESFLYDCFFLIATNPIFSTFLVVFDHRHIRGMIKRYRVSNQLIAVSQGEANATYQNMSFDICYKYGTMFRFLIFSAAIAILYPLAFIICFIAMFVLYWLDKFLLLRRYSIKLKITSRFTKLAQRIMSQFPIYISITTFIVMFIPVQDGRAFTEMGYSKAYYYLTGVAFFLSLVNYWVGNGWVKALFRYMLSIKFREEEEQAPEYKYIQNDLQTDYSHNYPYFRLTRQIGRQPSEQIRQEKVNELRKNQKLGTFDIIKHYMNQNRYS